MMATDGFWDHITEKEVAEITMNEMARLGGKPSGKVLSKCLLEAVLDRACKK